MAQTWKQLRDMLNNLEDGNPALQKERKIYLEGEEFLTDATLDDENHTIKDQGVRP